jgi:hypothetical protein
MTLLEFKKYLQKNAENSVPRPSLYCVWIPAHPGKDTPLIRVWIDPSMSMFESQATVHQPDLDAARSQALSEPGEGGAEDPVSRR